MVNVCIIIIVVLIHHHHHHHGYLLKPEFKSHSIYGGKTVGTVEIDLNVPKLSVVADLLHLSGPDSLTEHENTCE